MPADADIAEYLEDQSKGTVGTNLFYGNHPDSPDNSICVQQSAGLGLDPVSDFEQVGITILVRNTVYATGRDLANAILKLLHKLTNTTMETRLYHRIDGQGSVAPLGTDEKNRCLFSTSFIVIKEIE